MSDFIKKLFRRHAKARSAEDFVEAIKKEGCTGVAAELYSVVVAKDNPESALRETLYADFSQRQLVTQYMVKFVATTPRGRKIIHRECLFERAGSKLEVGDRRTVSIRAFLLGEQKVRELAAMLSGVPVELLVGPNRKPMDGRMYDRLHQAAATHGVSV